MTQPPKTIDAVALLAMAEEVREFTALKYIGDCKCGKRQLVPRSLVEKIYHTLNAASLLAATAPTPGGDARDIEVQDIEGRFAIRVEKLLCEALGREWSAAGISIISLIDELKARSAPTFGGDWNAAIEALRPFAKGADVADDFDRLCIENGMAPIGDKGGPGLGVTFGDFRRARDVIRALTRPTPTAAEPEGGEQPVAWRARPADGHCWGVALHEATTKEWKRQGWEVEPLYVRPSSPAVSETGEKRDA